MRLLSVCHEWNAPETFSHKKKDRAGQLTVTSGVNLDLLGSVMTWCFETLKRLEATQGDLT